MINKKSFFTLLFINIFFSTVRTADYAAMIAYKAWETYAHNEAQKLKEAERIKKIKNLPKKPVQKVSVKSKKGKPAVKKTPQRRAAYDDEYDDQLFDDLSHSDNDAYETENNDVSDFDREEAVESD